MEFDSVPSFVDGRNLKQQLHQLQAFSVFEARPFPVTSDNHKTAFPLRK